MRDTPHLAKDHHDIQRCTVGDEAMGRKAIKIPPEEDRVPPVDRPEGRPDVNFGISDRTFGIVSLAIHQQHDLVPPLDKLRAQSPKVQGYRIVAPRTADDKKARVHCRLNGFRPAMQGKSAHCLMQAATTAASPPWPEGKQTQFFDRGWLT